jgi:nitrogen PTS system EIIA component
MRLSQFLDFDAIKPLLGATGKRALFGMLGQIAGPRLGIDPQLIASTLSERERQSCTGFGNGVAIPHGRLAGLNRVYALMVRLAEPIDYKAIDGEPVDIVFLLLSPPDAGAEHLRALAAISRAARHGPTLDQMRGAKTRDALAAVLMGVDEPHVA